METDDLVKTAGSGGCTPLSTEATGGLLWWPMCYSESRNVDTMIS